MEAQHPINSVMQTTLENIKDMIDVNIVIGDPVVTGSGGTVIPVSKVGFGFVAGGGEYTQNNTDKPFAGGAGAGVSLQPVGFLVLREDGVHMLPAQNTLPFEHVIAMMPKLISDVKALFSGEEHKNASETEENA